MISCVRRLVYRLGFRPKQGSIFYSPSFYSPKDFIFDAYIREGSDSAMEELQQLKESSAEIVEELQLFFCPLCGSPLRQSGPERNWAYSCEKDSMAYAFSIGYDSTKGVELMVRSV